MANAINQNLEKLDILQVQANKQQVFEAHGKNLPTKQGKTLRTDLHVRDNKIFSDTACKSRKGSGSLGRETTSCQIQQDNLKSTILL
jgi:hypothetical protein